MGSLILPTSGVVYVDSSVLIYSLPPHPRYWPLLEPFWVEARAGRFMAVSSDLALLEVLVLPEREGNAALADAYEDLFQTDVRLLPCTQGTMRLAARLRAETRLRTPDAIHAASALQAGCALFLTNDPHFQRVPNLPVRLLDDALRA